MLPAYLNRIRIRSRQRLPSTRWTSMRTLMHVRFARLHFRTSRGSTFTCGDTRARGPTLATFAVEVSLSNLSAATTKNTFARTEMRAMLSHSPAGTVGSHTRQRRAVISTSETVALKDPAHNETACCDRRRRSCRCDLGNGKLSHC